MHTIKNRTNSPYDLLTKTGTVRIPAHGEISADFDEGYIEILVSSRVVEVLATVKESLIVESVVKESLTTEPPAPPHSDERDRLAQQLRERGIDFHHRMGIKKLQGLLNAKDS